MLQSLRRLNPEFQRNLWQEFSLHRLVAMPLILLVIFYISYSGHAHQFSAVAQTAIYLMLALLVIWGTGLSADAIFAELQDRTWETQRMTPLGAWSMTWGKLLGTTSYVWYGSIFCAIAFFIAKSLNTSIVAGNTLFFNFPKSLFDFIYCILTGISAQAFAFFCAILVQRISPMRSRARVTLIQIFAICVFIGLYAFGLKLLPTLYHDHSWYNLNIPYSVFILGSQLFFIVWLFIGIYRLLRVELQMKTMPWIWPLFVIFWVGYCLGYVYLSNTVFGHEVPPLISNTWYWGISYFLILNLSFLAAYFAPKNIIHAYRWMGYLKNRDYGNAATITPLWLISGVMAIIAVIPFIYYVIQSSAIEGKTFSLNLTGFAISMILFLIRDIGILYFLCWNPKAKRAHLATIVYLILLYTIVPTALSFLGLHSEWLTILLPGAWFALSGTTISQIISVNVVIALEVALVMYGVAYRWRQNKLQSQVH